MNGVFDSHREIEYRMKTETDPKNILVRLPTDDEWAERQRTRKVMRKSIGSMSQIDVDSRKADEELYQKIRLEGSPDLDTEEAQFIVKLVTLSEVIDLTPTDNTCEVLLNVPKAQVKHIVKWPSKKDVMKFQSDSGAIYDMNYGRQLIKVDPKPAGTLYNKYLISTEGYSNGSVPLMHKEAVMAAVLQFAEAEAQAQVDGF